MSIHSFKNLVAFNRGMDKMWWWWWGVCVCVCVKVRKEDLGIHHIVGLTAALCRWCLGMSTLADWVFLPGWLHFPLAFAGCRPWDLAQSPSGPLIQEFTTHLFCGAALPFHSRNFYISLPVYLPSVHFCPSFLPVVSWSKKKGHFPILYNLLQTLTSWLSLNN